MFLNFLKEHNPALIDYGVFLLKKGLIESDTYVLDLDAIEDNALRLTELSKKYNLCLYFMSKQIGRNPEVSRRVLSAGGAAPCGFTGMVAVDFREAELLHSVGLPVKHLGHLCQVPSGAWERALEMRPEIITLYSIEKASELSEASKQLGIVQDVLLRVRDEGDIFFQNQEGGFHLKTLPEYLDIITELPGLRIAGLTSFPCFLYNDDEGKSITTPNVRTIAQGASLLKEKGLTLSQINMPSCNSLATIPLAAELGATHLEPGHSLTGTNPDNLNEKEPLTPALLYMSEVSHHYEGSSYCFGGGYYRRSGLKNALVKTGRIYKESAASIPAPEAIDYHLQLSGIHTIGSPVCMSFRTQIFVTRSRVALAEGLSNSRPNLHSTWDSLGSKIK